MKIYKLTGDSLVFWHWEYCTKKYVRYYKKIIAKYKFELQNFKLGIM